MMMRALHTAWSLGVAVMVAIVASSTNAGSFSVSPVRASLSAAQAITSLTVHNSGVEPSTVQLQVMHWAQEGGKDVLTPSREILATPPLFTVPPGGSQVVRLGLRRAADARRELTYRLILTEVPPPRKPEFAGLSVTLRLSVPVFVAPPTAVEAALHWRVHTQPDGSTLVKLTNSGNAHIQVSSISLASFDTAAAGKLQASTYLLPGQSREWAMAVMAPIAAGAGVLLTAETDAGPKMANLVVEQP
jgi:fimbrial chaperone protein